MSAGNNNATTGHMLRADLPPLPVSMRALPIDSRGYPVPWFVAYSQGIPDFRLVDAHKFKRAIDAKLCWICGNPLTCEYLSFIAGPMVIANRQAPEPPSHSDCALYATTVCPFLTTPEHARRPGADPAAELPGGTFAHNPGVAVIWTTASYRTFDAGNGLIFELGEPSGVLWMCRGKPATRREAIDALRAGMPLLESIARDMGGDDEADDIRRRYLAALVLLPNE